MFGLLRPQLDVLGWVRLKELGLTVQWHNGGICIAWILWQWFPCWMHITLVLLCRYFSSIQLPVYAADYYHVILYSLCNPAPFSCAILFVKVGVRGSAFVCLLDLYLHDQHVFFYFVWRYPKSVQRSVSPWIWRNGAGKLGRYSWQKEMWRNPSNHVTENKSVLKTQNAWRTEKSTAGLRAYPSTAHC